MVSAKCVTYHTLPKPTATPFLSSTLVVTVLLGIHVLVAQSATVNVYQGGSIQDALDYVSPGDTIIINPGNYFEDIVTKVDGTESARITIKGSEDETNRGNVVLRGTGDINNIFEVKHDYYTIENFSIDGLGDEDYDDDDKYEDVYRDKLIYVHANREPTTREGGYRSTLDGIIIRDMNLINAGAECIRLRHFVTFAEIYGNSILNCGVYDFFYADGGKNGEGVYIGTAPDQWDDNYTDEPDETRGTRVHDNTIETNGSEGVDVKEGCVDTIIEDNEIYMQKDEDGGGISSSADGSIIRNNYIQDTDGAGIRVGGHRIDDHQYGVDNQIYGNSLRECRRFGVKIMESPQGMICGNTIEVPDGEDSDDYDFTGGEYGDDYDATEPCADAPSPVPEPTLAPPGSSGAYLGCFEDQMGARTMSSGYKDSENLTNEACIEYCSSNGNQFAGTFNGKKCRCTNNDWKVYRHGLSDQCTKECPGDEDQICGGKWAVSTWRING